MTNKMQFNSYARFDGGSSMASQSYATREEAEADLTAYVQAHVEQGCTPIVFTEIQASCAVCGGMGEHGIVRTARSHKRHYYCDSRCFKACPQSKLALPPVLAWA